MGITKIDVEEFHSDINRFLDSKEQKTYYIIYTEVRVNYGDNKDCNIAWCEEHSIPHFNAKRGAGCIVSAPGNIAILDIRRTDKKSWLVLDVLKEFVAFLKERGLNAKQTGNDVLVDGYKVASGVSKNLGPDYTRQYTGIQISLFQEYEIIKNVCLKPCVKQPKGLSEFGLSTEEVERWILKYFE